MEKKVFSAHKIGFLQCFLYLEFPSIANFCLDGFSLSQNFVINKLKFNSCTKISETKFQDLQFMSSLTEVETGTEMLLLLAWHVKMVWRSSLLRSVRTSSLMTLVFPNRW